MRLIKIYGKEDMYGFIKFEITKAIKKIKRESDNEINKKIVRLSEDLIALKTKLNDIERIMESYEKKNNIHN